MMTKKELVTTLKESKKETPLTILFDDEKDENGERKYGQNEKRWWDNSDAPEGVSKQKNHLIMHLACWHFNDGGPCKKNYKECAECFKNLDNLMNKVDMNPEKLLKDVFNGKCGMRMPELFICAAELLGLGCFGETPLKKIVDEIMEAMDDAGKDRNDRKKAGYKVVKKYITWDKVEKKLLGTL